MEHALRYGNGATILEDLSRGELINKIKICWDNEPKKPWEH